MLEAIVNQIVHTLFIAMVSIGLALFVAWRMARRYPSLAKAVHGWVGRRLIVTVNVVPVSTTVESTPANQG